MRAKANSLIDKRLFRLLVVLLIISFLDESEISWVSACALFATFLMPFIMILSLACNNVRLDKNDKGILELFGLFIIIQLIGISFDNLYMSITPIYRSITVAITVIYMRHFSLNTSKCNSIALMSVMALILGLVTIAFPARPNTNLLFGNYNTVGVLYFTLCVIQLMVYFKTRNALFLAFCIGDIAMIMLSNTRTALALVIIVALLYFVCKTILKSFAKPKIFLSVALIAIACFVYFYYNIKQLSIYGWLNDISQRLFHKNFDSGRPELWQITVDIVGNRRLLGCGTGIDLESFIPGLKTPHSVYFDLYLQNGLLGVIFYCLCIVLVLRKKGKWEKSDLSLIIMIASSVFIFYNAVGIVFTKARSGIGLLQWAILALPYQAETVKCHRRRMVNDQLNSTRIQRKTVY